MGETGASFNMDSRPTRPPSAVTKAAVLPPISQSSGDQSAAARPQNPPSPTNLCPEEVRDDNVDIFLSKKISLLRYLAGAPDLIEQPMKHEPHFRALCYGTEPSINSKHQNRLKLANALADNGHFSLLISYWGKVKLTDAGQWAQSAVSKKVTIRLLNLFYLFTPMWNGTDLGNEAYSKKFDDSLRGFYLKLLDSRVFSTFVNVEIQSLILSALLGTLHNLVHRYPEGSGQVRDHDGVRIIGPYTSHPDLLIKTKAILVLCYIVTETEASKLVVTEEHIKYIVQVLQDCIANADHCSRAHGYDAEEILDGLNRMAVADSNKEAIVKCGALPLYAVLLKDDCKVEEQIAACKGLWILAFNETNKNLIAGQADCMQGLQKLCRSDNDSLRREAEGALWAIEGEKKRTMMQSLETSIAGSLSVTSKSSEKQVGHLMLSYNWGVQTEVVQIKDRLKATGYKVWIDVEQMSGSTLDAMASAIEEASLVLIFFTEQYKMSPSCRSEAEYCYKMQRPFIPVRMQKKYIADGWLGLILGSKLFFDFTKPEAYKTTYEKLCKEIDHVINIQAMPNAASDSSKIVRETAVAVHAGQSKKQSHDFDTTDAPHPLEFVRLAASAWVEDDVKAWLCQNGLEQCCDRFQGFTGLHIAELHHAFMLAPNYFYKVLQRELGLPLKESLAFTKLVRELN